MLQVRKLLIGTSLKWNTFFLDTALVLDKRIRKRFMYFELNNFVAASDLTRHVSFGRKIAAV